MDSLKEIKKDVDDEFSVLLSFFSKKDNFREKDKNGKDITQGFGAVLIQRLDNFHKSLDNWLEESITTQVFTANEYLNRDNVDPGGNSINPSNFRKIKSKFQYGINKYKDKVKSEGGDPPKVSFTFDTDGKGGVRLTARHSDYDDNFVHEIVRKALSNTLRPPYSTIPRKTGKEATWEEKLWGEKIIRSAYEEIFHHPTKVLPNLFKLASIGLFCDEIVNILQRKYLRGVRNLQLSKRKTFPESTNPRDVKEYLKDYTAPPTNYFINPMPVACEFDSIEEVFKILSLCFENLLEKSQHSETFWSDNKKYFGCLDLQRLCARDGLFPFFQLNNCRLDCVSFNRSILVGADLSYSFLYNALLSWASFLNVNFRNAFFIYKDPIEYIKPNDDCKGQGFIQSDLRNADFTGSFFQKVYFLGSVLDKADFSGATFNNCFFVNSNLRKATVDGATFIDSYIDNNKDLEHVCLKAGADELTKKNFEEIDPLLLEELNSWEQLQPQNNKKCIYAEAIFNEYLSKKNGVKEKLNSWRE